MRNVCSFLFLEGRSFGISLLDASTRTVDSDKALWFKEGLHDMLLTDTTTPHRLVA
jgi:hypothetical protein